MKRGQRMFSVGVKKAAVLAGATMAVLLHAPLALACPACAARTSPGGAVFAWIALMIAIPYVIVAVTIRTIRKLERES